MNEKDFKKAVMVVSEVEPEENLNDAKVPCAYLIRYPGMRDDQQICSNHRSEKYDDWCELTCHIRKCYAEEIE